MATSLNRLSIVLGVVTGMMCTPACANVMHLPPPAYQLAAEGAGIPSAVLYAVALQESGIRIRDQLRPWPWTLNVQGTPLRYRTRQAACASLTDVLRRVSVKRVDVGLGQINIGYQAHRGIAPCDLLDPYRNLALAATILHEQHIPGKGWLRTIGRYHRPAGGAPAERYRRQVQQHLAWVLKPEQLQTFPETSSP